MLMFGVEAAAGFIHSNIYIYNLFLFLEGSFYWMYLSD